MEPAFILHRQNYSNSSLLLECFSRSHGRFPAIAKGIKTSKRGGGGILQPFNNLLLQWSGKGDVKTLTRYESIPGGSPPLRGKALYCGFYLNELLVRLLGRNDPHEQLFTIYEQTLCLLSEGGDLDSVLRYFELDLLQEIGFGLTLDCESDGITPVVRDARYCYDSGRGFAKVDSAQQDSTSGQLLLILQQRCALRDEMVREARSLMRGILASHLGDRPLKSRELFLSARAGRDDSK